jgi:hypothetical protein
MCPPCLLAFSIFLLVSLKAFHFVYSQCTKGRFTLLMRLTYYLSKKKLAVLGVCGVLLIPLVRTRWGFGRILGGVGGCFLVISDLSWEMAQRSNFWMMCSLEKWPLRKLSRIYIALLV